VSRFPCALAPGFLPVRAAGLFGERRTESVEPMICREIRSPALSEAKPGACARAELPPGFASLNPGYEGRIGS